MYKLIKRLLDLIISLTGVILSSPLILVISIAVFLQDGKSPFYLAPRVGKNGKEFGYMVEAGMPALAAIQSATLTNAMLLGVANEIGQIKPAFFADIIAVDENPLNNIKTLEQVQFVMKNGVVYKNQ